LKVAPAGKTQTLLLKLQDLVAKCTKTGEKQPKKTFSVKGKNG
jgi:hypothetical protein